MRPTCTGLRVRSPSDAQVIFHAVSLNILPMVSRRLDTDERRSISSGCVFVWQERGPNAEATGLGIERWTDGIRWGPSRVRDEFLFYHEKDPAPVEDVASDSDASAHSQAGPSRGFLRNNLIKQTYSVFVDTPSGRRKWHLIAYFTQESVDYLRSIEDIPQLAALSVPPGMYKSARSAKGRPRDQQTHEQHALYSSHVPQPQYAGYGVGGQGSPPPPGPPGFMPKLPPPGWAENPTFQHQQHHHHHTLHHVAGVQQGRTQPRADNVPKAVDALAPLAYLQTIMPPRRHPLDEQALMSLSPRFP
jgi:hypothetical protein